MVSVRLSRSNGVMECLLNTATKLMIKRVIAAVAPGIGICTQ